MKDRINPELEHRQVDPRLKQGLSAARWVSSHTVKASGYLVSKAGDASLALGRFLGKSWTIFTTGQLCCQKKILRSDQHGGNLGSKLHTGGRFFGP